MSQDYKPHVVFHIFTSLHYTYVEVLNYKLHVVLHILGNILIHGQYFL